MLIPLIGGVVVLGAAVLIEAYAAEPLIPPRFFTNRTRLVANAVTLLLGCSFLAYFFLLTLFEQQVLEYSPLRSGLSYVPFGLAIGAGIGISTGLLARAGVKPVLTAGLLVAGAGLLLTGGISVHTGYLGGILPGMILFGLGSGMCFPANTNASLHETGGQDSGLASGVQSTMQQLGGALGLAVLGTLGLRHALGEMQDGVSAPVAATLGYVLSFRIGAALLAVAAVLVLALMQHVQVRARDAAVPEPVPNA